MTNMHGVWKSQKKSYSTLWEKQATFTCWVDKSWLKMPKIVHFGEFLNTWSLRTNSVTRQVNFDRSKIGGKCQNWKFLNATFWVIFKHCARATSQELPPSISREIFMSFEWKNPQFFFGLRIRAVSRLFPGIFSISQEISGKFYVLWLKNFSISLNFSLGLELGLSLGNSFFSNSRNFTLFLDFFKVLAFQSS